MEEPLNGYIDQLLGLNSAIDRQEEWAKACYDLIDYVNNTLSPADLLRVEQYYVAVTLKQRYEADHPSDSPSDTVNNLLLLPLQDAYYGTHVEPVFHCMGNPRRSNVVCHDTFTSAYAARDDHKLECRGSKDPNSHVNGCGGEYYKCQPRTEARHRPRTCIVVKSFFHKVDNKWVAYQSEGCGEQFRFCWHPDDKRGPHSFYQDENDPSIFSKGNYRKHIAYKPPRTR